MKNTALVRSFALALALLTASAPVTRAAYACGGGYGGNIDPNRGSARTIGLQLKFALAQSNRAEALALFAPDASVELPESAASCCPRPPIAHGEWVAEALRDRTFSLGNILGVSNETGESSYFVHFVEGTREGARINTTLTVRFVEGRARITHVVRQYGSR